MKDLVRPWKLRNEFTEHATIVLHNGDASKFLATIPDKTVTLVVTSPPYNIGKPYEERTAIGEYLANQSRVISQLHRVLRDDGSVCWQVGNYVKKGEVYPLDILFYDVFKLFGFKLRNRMIWHYRHGLHAQRRFSGRYETILWFTKTDEYTFNLDSVRVPALYPGKRYYKGPKKGQPSGSPKGKNPSDVWEIVSRDWQKGIWDIPNVKAHHPEKTIQPCQFPVELVQRCVLALTKKGDWVLDPYAGVGSTLIAAALHGRRSLGSEKDRKYYNIALERLQALREGTLKLRPLGKPIHIPTGNEMVARIPDEWRRAKRKGTTVGHMVYAAIARAVKTRRLREPFSSGDFKKACPGFAPATYGPFLAKHARGNPGGNSELFVRVAQGRYRCIRPFRYGF